MILLSRLRLINWHNFADDLLDIQQITYLIGVNGVGKTTILDALRYCLTTNKNFNALGNRKSKRTLLGSVHGKQRDQDEGRPRYSRKGHTVSYIGAEFQDEAAKPGQKSFVIVVRVESENPDEDMRHVQQRWYITPRGVTLEELPFLGPDRVPTKREQFCLKRGKMQNTDKQETARDWICRALGIGSAESPLGKKFCAVFPMGTSIDNIADFREFIYQYILPQPELDLQLLQQEQIELDHLSDVLLQAKARAQMLTEIGQLGETAHTKQRDCAINRGFVLYAKQQATAQQEEKILSDITVHNQEIQRLEEELRRQRARVEQAQHRLLEAQRENQNSSERQRLLVFEDLVKAKRADYDRARKALSTLKNAQQSLEALNRMFSQCQMAIPEEQMPDGIRLLPQRRESEALSALSQLLQERELGLDQAEFNARSRRRQMEQRRGELQTQINALNKGQLVYPDGDRARRVCQTINRELSQMGLEPDARILCEILTVRDPDWQECAEACLGNRRFDILVSPKHYHTAKEAFARLKGEVGQVSLLDSPALERDAGRMATAPDSSSLAAKLTSENWLAQYYVNSLLGQIVCCDTPDTLERYPQSATRDLLRHYPYRLARLRTPVMFIGLEARKKQLESAKAEFSALSAKLADCTKQADTLTEALDTCRRVLHGTVLADLRDNWDSEQQQQACWQALEQAQQEYDAWKNNPILQAKMTLEHSCQLELDSQRDKQVTLEAQRQTEQNCVAQAQAQQSQAIADAEAAQAAWQEFCQQESLLQTEAEKKYADAVRTRAPEKIVEFQTNYQRQVDKALEDWVREQLIPKQQEYNGTYTCDYPLGLEGIEIFREQRDRLVHVDLERYATSLDKAKERCRQRFREDILYRMKDDIINAKRQFRELNRTMGGLQYGEEVYQFMVQASTDPERRAFYDVIMRESNRPIQGDGSIEDWMAMGDAAYESQVNELMERILAELSANAQRRLEGKQLATELSRYVDYRYYLEYDIECHNQITGGTIRLSAVSQDSSGGENQAPFYIAICASLLQIYDKCENSIRLVLLDEAFSRMTSDRIRPMMQMLRKMRLQVVLITTVEKASAIQPYCDVTCSIVKSGTRNAVRAFYQEVI